MKTIKKILAITLALALVVAFAPAGKTAKAGEGMSFIDIISGVNKTELTVKSTDTVRISLSNLNTKIPGFKSRYLNGESSVHWSISKADGSRVTMLDPKLNGDILEYRVEYKYKGMNMTLFVDDPDHTNYQGETFKILGFTVTILEGPSFGNLYATKTFLKKNITIWLNGYGAYTLNDDPTEYTTNKKIVKLYRNGKLVGTQKTSEYEVEFKNVPVSYGKNDTFKAVLYMDIEGAEIQGPSTTFKLTSQNVPNIKAYATKISAKKAYLRWQSVGGVTGYYIYMGKKKVKTVGAKTNKKMITKKKAGKSRFKVIPFVRVSGKVYKSTSNVAKPKKNQVKWSRNLNVKSYGYATCPFVVTKISLSGKTYTVTGYALNNRMWKVKKYKSLTVGLRVDGKKAFNKKFKNKKLNIKEYKKKKIVLKIKGKAGADLANGSVSLSVGQNPDWGVKNDPFKD